MRKILFTLVASRLLGCISETANGRAIADHFAYEGARQLISGAVMLHAAC